MAGEIEGKDKVAGLLGKGIAQTVAIEAQLLALEGGGWDIDNHIGEGLTGRNFRFADNGDGMATAIDGIFEGNFEGSKRIEVGARRALGIKMRAARLGARRWWWCVMRGGARLWLGAWRRRWWWSWLGVGLVSGRRFGGRGVCICGGSGGGLTGALFKACGGFEDGVVIAAQRGVAEGFVGLFDQEKGLMATGLIGGDIGVMYARKAAERLGDLLLRGVLSDLKPLVKILEDHGDHGCGRNVGKEGDEARM